MYWFYILKNTKTDWVHLGMSTDLKKTIAFYNDMPKMFTGFKHYLVYCEGYITQEELMARFKQISIAGKDAQVDLIKTINPEMGEIIPGVHFDLE